MKIFLLPIEKIFFVLYWIYCFLNFIFRGTAARLHAAFSQIGVSLCK